MRGRIEPEGGRARGEEIEVLGAPDRPSSDRLDIDEARLAEPLEVETDGIGVQREPLGQILRGQRRRGAGELPVHGEARLVSERLQHGELVGLGGHRA